MQGSGAPDPLPVRGAHVQRPNPAEAVPGIRAEDRAAVETNAGAAPTPRGGAVRGTMGKPQLPRRRAQEHIVPQLRGGPAPRQDCETVVGHDPGLMAAFQRGVGLAEAQQHLESAHMESAHMDAPHRESAHGEPSSMDSAHLAFPHRGPARTESAYPESAHTESAHTESAYTESAYMESAYMDSARTQSLPRESARTASGHMGTGHRDADHLTPAHRDIGSLEATPMNPPPGEAAPIREAHAHAPASDGIHGTGRTDGSAPAR